MLEPYETADSGGRIVCIRHGLLRCGDCAYIDELEVYIVELENKKNRYREAFKDIRTEIYDAVSHKKSSLEILEAISKVTLEALESESE